MHLSAIKIDAYTYKTIQQMRVDRASRAFRLRWTQIKAHMVDGYKGSTLQAVTMKNNYSKSLAYYYFLK